MAKRLTFADVPIVQFAITARPSPAASPAPLHDLPFMASISNQTLAWLLVIPAES